MRTSFPLAGARTLTLALLLVSSAVAPAPALAVKKDKNITLTPVGTYSTGVFDQGAAEIAAYDPATRRLFVVNGGASAIDVLDISTPSAPSLLFSIDVSPYGRQANSVDVRDGVIAAAVEANVKTDSGQVVFFDANGAYLNSVTVGALPDMLTFTPDGRKLLVANEGEPNNAYTVDPEGSVSIIDLENGAASVTQADVTTAGFGAFARESLDASVRVFGPNATVAQDLEPEYIAVSHDSKTAWVTLQENNALGILDLRAGRFTRIAGLGFKDHNLAGQGLDASDRDGRINIANWPVFGMYQPDGIASFRSRGETFLVTANEGDAREYIIPGPPAVPVFVEEARVGSLPLDPVAFPNAAALKASSALGRLTVTRATGDEDGDGDFDRLYAFGARSFSVRRADGSLLFDSGDQIERITAAAYPDFFNAGHTNNTFDDRSDNKGPEPEGVTVGKAFGRNYAFVGLERIGGVIVYDLTEPALPRFVQYVNNRFFVNPFSFAAAGDLGPEGLLFISEDESPNGRPLLVVANEVSGTTTVYEIARDK